MNPPNVPGNPPPPASMPAAANPSGGGMFSGRNIIIGLIALVLLCVCACGGLFVVTGGAIATVFTQVGAPSAIGGEFLTAINLDDYAKAYSLCTPALQGELGSPAGLGQRITNGNAKPASWSISNSNLNNNHLEMSGTATFTNGRTGTFSLVILKDGSDWKVDAFNLTPR
jgi:hypothetical protein